MELKYDFLDEKAYLGVAEIREEKKEYFELVYMIIELMTKLMNSKEFKEFITPRDKYILSTLYDCYVTYSSEMLLLERGLTSDFEILLRTFYEKKFKLFAVIKNKRNFKYAINEGLYFRTKLRSSIEKNENGAFDDLAESIKSIDDSSETGKPMPIKSWATNAGLIKEYDKEYALLSGKVHFEIGSLSSKILENEKETTYYTYSYDNFNEHLLIASHQFYICILKVLEYKNFNLLNDNIEKINEKFDELGK